MRRGRFPCVVCITSMWLILATSPAGGQGLRIVSPPDGTVVEPGETLTVAVEPGPGTSLQFVGIIIPEVAVDSKDSPPFVFTVRVPADAPLGPHPLLAAARDDKDRLVEAVITIQVETTTPATSLRVTTPALFIATKRRISVSGTFADRVTRKITRSRETTYSSSDPQVATATPDGLVEAVDPGTATITVSYKDKTVTVPVTVKFKKLTVPLDIKPKDPRNTINLNSGGPVRVAILSTADFSASTVNARTVKFGPAGAPPDLEHVKTRDVNRDGQDDLVLRFRIQETGIQCGEATATLTGRTVLGDRVRGIDAIRVVGKACR
ncbi:MAG: Ig domain-containing protein [Candidatus Methylomirabilales bacterium]